MGIDPITLGLVALGVSAVAGGAGTTASLVNASQARKSSRHKEANLRREQSEAEARAAQRAAADEEATLSSLKRSRYGVGRGVSRGGTIATSPVGVVGGSGASTGGQKTLLGS